MRSIITILLCAPWLCAEPAAPADTPDPAAAAAAAEALFAERESPAALQRAVEKARAAGVVPQQIFEARFLFLVDQSDDDGLIALLPEFEKLNQPYKPNDSAIFSTEEDWLAIGSYLKALAALKRGDKPAFKQHITEAFWLSPSQGAAFAPHIEKLRLADAMSALKLDLAAEFKTIDGKETQSLKKIIGDKKALLLHFWSPWSDSGDDGMADFKATAKVLADAGVAVASVLPDASPKLVADAAEVLKGLGAKPPGAWIADVRDKTLHRSLRVRGYPTMVLVAPDGAILCNANPADDALWTALRKVVPELRRPQRDDAPPAH